MTQQHYVTFDREGSPVAVYSQKPRRFRGDQVVEIQLADGQVVATRVLK